MIRSRQPIHDLVELMSGGLQITTGLDGRPLPPPVQQGSYTGKQFEAKGIRTIIQPDMDVVTMLSPELLAMGEVWDIHTAVVIQKLTVIDTMRRWIERSWLLFALFPAGWLLYDLVSIGFPAAWLSLARSAILTALLYWGRRGLTRGIFWGLGRYLRAKIKTYWATTET